MYDDLNRDQLEKALAEIEEELEKAESDRNEWENTAKKVKADFENYKKKEKDRKSRWKKEAQRNLAEDLIEVMDNLERAIMSADQETALLKGVKMVADQLYQKLEEKGLERIDAEGEEFDPKLHKAIDTENHEEHNKVLKERRKGYMYENQVIRESEVIVGKKENN